MTKQGPLEQEIPVINLEHCAVQGTEAPKMAFSEMLETSGINRRGESPAAG